MLSEKSEVLDFKRARGTFYILTDAPFRGLITAWILGKHRQSELPEAFKKHQQRIIADYIMEDDDDIRDYKSGRSSDEILRFRIPPLYSVVFIPLDNEAEITYIYKSLVYSLAHVMYTSLVAHGELPSEEDIISRPRKL